MDCEEAFVDHDIGLVLVDLELHLFPLDHLWDRVDLILLPKHVHRHFHVLLLRNRDPEVGLGRIVRAARVQELKIVTFGMLIVDFDAIANLFLLPFDPLGLACVC